MIPDHWLPLVLVARARKWSLKKALWVAGLSNLFHVALTATLGMVALVVGLQLSRAIGEAMEQVAGVLLVLFGLGYAFWSWRGGGEHSHAPAKRFEEASAYLLALILGMDPCVAAFPIFFAGGALGVHSFTLLMISFSLGTIGGALTITALALRGLYGVETLLLERYGDLASGILIAIMGMAFLLLE